MEQITELMRRRIAVIGLSVITVLCVVACQGEGEEEQENSEQEQDAGIDSMADADLDQANDVATEDEEDATSEASDDVGTEPTQDADAPDDTAQDTTDEETTGDDAGSEEPEEIEELDEIELAADGEAKLAIVLGANADAETSVGADELADYLEQISGAPFTIESGSGASGIVLGTLDDFDDLPMDDITFGDGTFEREDYVLRSTEDGLYLLGATPLAVRFAVWDLLYRLGHRQFFPTDTWEVIPEKDELSIAVDVREEPDYFNRQAPRGAMRMDMRPWAQPGWDNWQLRNRITPTFTLHTGHVYDAVIIENQAAFDANPEYWGLVDGQRTSNAQPNIAHEAVQQMFINHALARFNGNPSLDSVAMDPRDGNRWSESAESLAIGSPSDQAVHLANLVAEAVVDAHGEDKYIGMYGYSHHSPPPQIDAHPNVIVSLATGFIRGGYTFEQMIDGWSERTEMIGIREYYGLWIWDYSLPGDGARAANTEYIRDTISHFHDRGARFMNAESNDTWGGYGLGYYLAARMMWDVDETERLEELIDDFVSKAFGSAKVPMAEFYALIDGSATDPYAPARPQPLNDDMVGRMYRLLEEARDLAGEDDAVRARIEDLILYTHYVELFRRYDSIDGPQRQQAFDDFVSFAWRIRATMMAESVELTREINREVNVDSNLQWGAGYSTNRPANIHRVDEDKPFSDQEITTILQEGIDNHDLLDFDLEPWEDSGVLIPANLPADDRGSTTGRVNRGSVRAILSTDDGTLPSLTISAGHIYDDRGPVRWTLRDEQGALLDSGEAPPDEQDHHFELSAAESGKYQFSISNTGQGFVWDYEPRGSRLTLLAGGEYELEQNWYDRLYYYVPEGTEDIYIAGTLMEGRHEFVDGDGNVINSDAIEVTQGYTRVPVPQGQDGAVWSLELVAWRPGIRFLNIPGYASLSPEELLLPEELTDELP